MRQTLHYAGFWNRFAALIIDVLILLIPQALFGYLIGTSFVNRMASTDPVQNYIGFDIMSRGIGLGIAWLYFALLESSKYQATIGKMALGLVVTDLSGNPTSFGRASGRFFGKLLSSIIMGIGYLLAGFTARKQALHDILAHCLVLKKAIHVSASPQCAKEELEIDDEQLYLTAQKELDANAMREGLWAKAFEQYPSDDNMRKATYLRFRVAQLRAEAPNNSPPPMPTPKRIGDTRVIAWIKKHIPLLIIGAFIAIAIIASNWSTISQFGINAYYDLFWKTVTRERYVNQVNVDYTQNGQRHTLRNYGKVAYRGHTIVAFHSSSEYSDEWKNPNCRIEGATDISVYTSPFIW